MRSRIFYFSSTGNTLFAARRLALGLGAQSPESIVPMRDGVKDEAAATVGLCFPVYLHKAPSILRDFVARSRFGKDAYVFALATHNGGPGSCMRGVDAALRRGGSSLAAGFGLLMPGNSVILADLTNAPEERARRLAESDAAIAAVAARVLAREENDFSMRESPRAWAQSRAYAAALAAYRLPRHFHASQDCSRCGLCSRACPRDNVELGAYGPSWGGDCLSCLACYHACPLRAIDIDEYTRARLRYRHPSIRLEELLYR